MAQFLNSVCINIQNTRLHVVERSGRKRRETSIQALRSTPTVRGGAFGPPLTPLECFLDDGLAFLPESGVQLSLRPASSAAVASEGVSCRDWASKNAGEGEDATVSYGEWAPLGVGASDGIE
jgi:hypothetical protein